MAQVIHFIEFEDMIDELSKAEPVRVNVLNTTQYVFVEQPDYSRMLVGLHVRQFLGNAVLSWMMPFGEYDAYKGVAVDGSQANVRDLALQQAEVIKDMVVERLLQHSDGIDIRPGIIDLGPITFHLGTWKAVELIQETVEAEPATDSQ